jgi:D-alanyl-D-alanine carboxypeptidase/D-alanyl-D-alanine-endopeptidase (penicillin-binding protein 4)
LPADEQLHCLRTFSSDDAFLLADTEGKVVMERNGDKHYVPASTLKVLTAMAAIDHFGPQFRFRTDFYLDGQGNLKVKGFGDPLLVSEIWSQIAVLLSNRIDRIEDLMVDDTYFSPRIRIPGLGSSVNPYDAPVGALCANFNTVFFKRNPHGTIISAEPETPMLSFVRRRIISRNLPEGRITFTHDGRDAALYAGELLSYFLSKQGVYQGGEVKSGTVGPGDCRILSYNSRFTLKNVIAKMLEFSNNFIANQVTFALGAHIFGPPATLQKGVGLLRRYARGELMLQSMQIMEGSGISRKNRVTPKEMVKILKKFRPHRYLMKREGGVYCKSGTLRGVSARAGYIETERDQPFFFVFFSKRRHSRIIPKINCLKKASQLHVQFHGDKAPH